MHSPLVVLTVLDIEIKSSMVALVTFKRHFGGNRLGTLVLLTGRITAIKSQSSDLPFLPCDETCLS